MKTQKTETSENRKHMKRRHMEALEGVRVRELTYGLGFADDAGDS